MKLSFLGSAFLLCILVAGDLQFVYAQRVNYFTLPPLTDVAKVPWRQSTYRFPEFQKGKITYTKGFELDHEFDLNYNIYYEKMFFISSSGDTLSITNTREIKSVQIGNKSFFHDYISGFYEVILPLPVALVFRNKFVLKEIEYNSGVRRDATFTEVRGVPTDFARIYEKDFLYFFVDQKNELNKATKPSILKLFPDRQVEIQGYFLEHPVDFESREDLIELTTFCNQFILPAQSESTDSSEAFTVRLQAGKSFPSENVIDSLYRFSEFQEAKIMWVDKSTTYYPQKMNYNLFTGKMDLVDEKGDTVKFKKWQQAKILNLDGNVFFQDFEEGYLEILLQGNLALAVKNSFMPVTKKERLTDAGLMDQAAASTIANSAPITNYDRLYELQKAHFFIYKNQVNEVSKMSILRLMSRDREEVIEYMNENNTSLQDEQDLIKLTSFCNGLLAKKMKG